MRREDACGARLRTMKRVLYFIFLLLTALALAASPVCAEQETTETTAEAEATIEPDSTAEPDPTDVPEPVVRFTRDFSSAYAEYGNRVTLSYTVRNDGALPVEEIYVRDGLIGEVGYIERLEPGEKKTLSARARITESCTSTPEMTYTHAGQAYEATVASGRIALASVEVRAELDADKTNVAPGETVTLRLKIVNGGNVNLYGLRASEPALGDMGSLVNVLAPGDECAVTRTVQMKSAGTFQFSVTGSSDTGEAFTLQSNEMSVLVTPVAAEIRMTLRAQADRTELTEPGAVCFSLYLNNECSLELRDVTLAEETCGELRRLLFVPAGEMPVMTEEIEVKESGVYRFRAQVADSVGDRTTVYSEPIEITVSPTREAEATGEPAGATDAPQETTIPVLDGAPYRMEENPATFERLMLGTSLLLLVILLTWYIATKWRRFVKRRRAKKRKRLKRDKSKQANGKK